MLVYQSCIRTPKLSTRSQIKPVCPWFLHPLQAGAASYLGSMACLGIEKSLTLIRSKKFLACLVLPRLVPRCCVPIGITSLSRVELVKLACAVMDLSPPLQSFDSPKRMPRPSISHGYAFNFSLSAVMVFTVMGADCTNAYANSPSSTQAT
jgi:hypothetical protein